MWGHGGKTSNPDHSHPLKTCLAVEGVSAGSLSLNYTVSRATSFLSFQRPEALDDVLLSWGREERTKTALGSRPY